MPMYRNNALTTKVLPGYCAFVAGETRVVTRYVWPLPADFELIEHSSSPVRRLHEGAIPTEAVEDLAQYHQVIIVNDSGEDVVVVANDDNDNSWTVLSGQTWPIEQDHEVDKLAFSGAGEGSIYVYGIL